MASSYYTFSPPTEEYPDAVAAIIGWNNLLDPSQPLLEKP
jgi:hypothetical protein